MKKNYQKPTINKIVNLKRIHVLVGSPCNEDQGSEQTCLTESSCSGEAL